MKATKFFAVICLGYTLWACAMEEWEAALDIDIGDYQYHLAEWNNQNMPSYQLKVIDYSDLPGEFILTVKNDVAEGAELLGWYAGKITTISEIFLYIKELEESMIAAHNKGDGISRSLSVIYHKEFHYPVSITSKHDANTERWFFDVMPLEEGVLEIHIGDYDSQLVAWNSQNILNYFIYVTYEVGRYSSSNPGVIIFTDVINGVPTSSYPLFGKGTIPEIFSFIKEEEERITNVYNGENRSFLHVEYDEEYHYPTQINTGIDHLFGSYSRWEITVTPLEQD